MARRALKIVVDTHVLLWWQAESDRVSRRAQREIDRVETIMVCAITCWEIGMLVAKKRIGLDRPVRQWIHDLLAEERIELVPLSPDIAVTAAEFPEFHGDPADRLIYATAVDQRVPLVTADSAITNYATDTGSATVIW